MTTIPADLAEIIAIHRGLFGGFTMMADEAKEEKPETAETKSDDKDEALGENGIKALRAEREAREALEAQVKELKGAKETLDALAKVFVKDGEKPDATVDLAAKVTDVIKRLDAADAKAERDALAKQVAKEAGVTDASDIELIGQQADEEAMKALAKRLGGTPVEQDRKRRGVPGPDQSAGRGGSNSGRPTSIAQVMEERRAAREKNH